MRDERSEKISPKNFRELRRRLELTQASYAKQIGVGKGRVSDIEQSKEAAESLRIENFSRLKAYAAKQLGEPPDHWGRFLTAGVTASDDPASPFAVSFDGDLAAEIRAVASVEKLELQQMVNRMAREWLDLRVKEEPHNNPQKQAATTRR